MSELDTYNYVDLNSIENANNYVPLTNAQFIKIISGEEISYTQPLTANAQWNYRQDLEKSRKLGEEPRYFTIQLPNEYWTRGRVYREQMYITRPKELQPDIDKPLVHRIEGGTYWFRGINYPEQDIPRDLIHPIFLRYCQFENIFNVNSVKSGSSFKLSNCQFLATGETNTTLFSFRRSTFRQITINQVSASREGLKIPISSLYFEEVNTDELAIYGCYVKQLEINCHNSIIRELRIEDSEIGELIIRGGHIENCQIKNLSESGYVSISSTFDKLTIQGRKQFGREEKLFSQHLFLHLLNQKKGTVLIKNIGLNNLSCLGENNNDLIITGVRAETILFSELINLAIIRLRNIECVITLSIEESVLGRTEVSNVSFDSQAEAKIHQSNIEEVNIHNTKFPNIITGKDENDVEGMREAYRQLKYASAKYGNRLAELKYQQLEMNAHYNALHGWADFGDRIVLYLSRVSTNFGQSWLQGFGTAVVSGIITYTIYCWSLGFRIGSDWSLFWKLSSYFLEYLNPLHRADFITEDLEVKRNGWSITWDNLSRIINGFFVYQMVQAFRKFGKS